MSKRGEEKDDASVAAAYWLLALEEAPDDAELHARFRQWLTARPENEAAWAGTSDVYDMIGTPAYAAHRAARDAGGQGPAATIALGAVRARRRRFVLSAAVLAIAASLAFVALPGLLLWWQADHVTSVAESRSITLEDGSTVRLAPGSAIEVLPGADRAVRLLRGEALFEVRRDTSRQFRVVAGGVETTVLGTVFDVRLLADGALVAVSEGEVRVDLPTAVPPVSERLKAGDWARVEQGSPASLGTLPPSEVAAWRRGQIVARDRTIGDVIEEVRRSYSGLILVTDRTLTSQRVTGVYNLDDPPAALRAVVGVYGAHVRQLSPWVMVVSGG